MKKFFLAVLISIPLFSNAQAGLPDSTFDGDGLAVFDDETGFGNIYSIGLQSDGKIIIGGRMIANADYNNWVFYRFTEDGKLDSTFGTNGKADIDFNQNEDFGYAFTIQPDDKIVACGISKVGNGYNGAIARLTADGDLDNTFSNDGKLIVSYQSEFDGISIDANGNVIVVGRITNGLTLDFLIRRFLDDGTEDGTFIPTNYKLNDIDWSNDLAILTNGEILVSGVSLNTNIDQHFVVLKYKNDGTIDSTFGADGSASVDFPEYTEEDQPFIAIDPDGRILLCGYGMGNIINDILVARFTPDGILDSTFSSDGKLTTDVLGFVDRGRGVITQPDGKIIVTGYARQSIDSSGVVLIRYRSDGSLDGSFANNGIAYNLFSKYSEGWDVMFQPDGKILVSGYADTESLDVTKVAVLRFLNDIALPIENVADASPQLNVFPNPVTSEGTIQFSLIYNSEIEVTLFDLQGRKIKKVANGLFQCGNHHLALNTENLSNGIYLLQLKTDSGILTQKVVVQ